MCVLAGWKRGRRLGRVAQISKSFGQSEAAGLAGSHVARMLLAISLAGSSLCVTRRHSSSLGVNR
ncbi:MAG: hypothetical protein QGF59_11230, partial [Pirellulaceae bacterium]|nr:hypothetical protein [Pirellulaceae bacterium]